MLITSLQQAAGYDFHQQRYKTLQQQVSQFTITIQLLRTMKLLHHGNCTASKPRRGYCCLYWGFGTLLGLVHSKCRTHDCLAMGEHPWLVTRMPLLIIACDVSMFWWRKVRPPITQTPFGDTCCYSLHRCKQRCMSTSLGNEIVPFILFEHSIIFSA